MKLIVILMVLAITRYTNWQLPRHSWVEHYFTAISSKLEQFGIGKGLMSIVIAIAVPALGLLIINDYFSSWFGGLISLAINLMVLWYCVDAKFWELCGVKLPLIVTATDDSTQVIPNHDQIVCSLWRAHEQLFAVLFWYFLLGPVGALAYRLMTVFKSTVLAQQHSEVAIALQDVQAYADWIPIRLLGLGFTLAGNFNQSFSYWYDLALSDVTRNYELITNCGLLALGLDLTEQAKEPVSMLAWQDTPRLIKRTLVIYLVMIALLSLM